MIAPAPTQTPSTRGDDRLRAGAHRLDQVAGHAREGEQARHVHLGQRADDLVHVAARAEIAAGAGDHHGLDVVARRPARGTCRAARHRFRRSAGSSAPAGSSVTVATPPSNCPAEMRRLERLRIDGHWPVLSRCARLRSPKRVIETFARRRHPCRRAGRRSSRDGRRRGRRTRRGPSAVSRTIEVRRSPGAVARSDQPVLGQLLDELGDVAVGDEQGARQRAHVHALADGGRARRARRSGQGGVERAAKRPLHLLLDRHACRSSSRSHSRTLEPVGERAVMLLADRRARLAHPSSDRLAVAVGRGSGRARRRRPPPAAIRRPCGLSRASSARASSSLRPVLRLMFAIDASEHVGVDEARADGIDPDAVSRIFGGKRAHQPDRAMLGGDIGRGIGDSRAGPAVEAMVTIRPASARPADRPVPAWQQ